MKDLSQCWRTGGGELRLIGVQAVWLEARKIEPSDPIYLIQVFTRTSGVKSAVIKYYASV